ncbi:MAG: LuxR family transcriptional regulator [Frankiales bacterium]|nr:LuxR family transcriptional regulator [Frankiales bacterium]
MTLTVAVLDDHEVVLEGLIRGLERHGVDVVVNETAATPYLVEVERHRPAVCLVDLRLGGEVTGFDVVARCRELSPDSRVAVLTSNEDPRAAARAIEAGASGYLLKDIAMKQLVDRLEAVRDGNLVLDERVAEGVLRPQPGTRSPQNRQLLKLVAAGLTNRQIGAEMHLSPHTVKEYLSKIMRELGTHTRAETVATASQRGLLDD